MRTLRINQGRYDISRGCNSPSTGGIGIARAGIISKNKCYPRFGQE